MLNFYMTPGSCSTGIHILLEELELVFSAHLVNLLRGDQNSEEFLAINSKGTIPVLVLDNGTALTSFSSIAWWLGKTYPKLGLIPEETLQQTKMMELLNFAVNQIHGLGFTRIFTPEQYLYDGNNPSAIGLIKQQGEKLLEKNFNWLASQLDNPYAVGAFSLADAALFYVEFWADRSQIPLPANCQDHYQAMLKRPAVRQVLAEEGYRL